MAPKKFFNRHASEANNRIALQEDERKASMERTKEDELWADNDPKLQKRQEKNQQLKQKADDDDRRRAERRAQEVEEDKELNKAQPVKVTKRQMQREVARMVANYDKTVNDEPPPPLPKGNPNLEVNKDALTVEASGKIENALTALAGSHEVEDRLLGKRAKVLYKHFADEHLPVLKTERPGLRRTQYNNLLWELWQKSPENPFVVKAEHRAASEVLRERNWMQEASDDEGEES